MSGIDPSLIAQLDQLTAQANDNLNAVIENTRTLVDNHGSAQATARATALLTWTYSPEVMAELLATALVRIVELEGK